MFVHQKTTDAAGHTKEPTVKRDTIAQLDAAFDALSDEPAANAILARGIDAFVPFPTALYAEHLGHDGAREAAIAYGLNFIIIAIFFQVFWQYARRRLLRHDADRREVTGINRSYWPGVPLYVAATLLALLSPTVALAMFAGIALVYVSASIWGDEEVAKE